MEFQSVALDNRFVDLFRILRVCLCVGVFDRIWMRDQCSYASDFEWEYNLVFKLLIVFGWALSPQTNHMKIDRELSYSFCFVCLVHLDAERLPQSIIEIK